MSRAERTRPFRLLAVVDDSEATKRMLAYVTRFLIRAGADERIFVCLGYILPTMPARLLEFGGSENPGAEKRLTETLKKRQGEWTTAAEAIPDRCLAKARSHLQRAGVAASMIDICMTSPLDQRSPVDEVMLLAREQECGTIVLG